MKHLQFFLCTIGLAAVSTPSLIAQSQDDWVEWGHVDGLNQGDSFGSSISPLSDVNNDSHDDYLVSSPQSSSYLRRAGSLSIISGKNDSVIASASGSSIGQQMGYSICVLGEHDGDGLLKIAASSPFSNTSNGMFSGVVNIYAFDPGTSELYLWQELAGDNAGAMFGVSVAALDNDGDGDLDLAVGSLGDGAANGGALDGSIRFFDVSNLVADETGTNPQYGEPNSGEMFGFAMCYADINNGEGLLIGVPFANADNSGAAILYQASSNQLLMPPLEDPLPTANANLGFAVAAGSDITGDGKADFIASAPNAGAGTVITWRLPLEIGRSLSGSNSGEKFGYSVAITIDSNFNNSDDLIVGAPEAGTDNGRFAVHDMSSLDQTVLYSASGSSGQLFGNAVATAGDVNQSTKSEVLVGAIGTNDGTGRVYIYSPPEEDIGAIELEAVGNYEWETDMNLNATNLSQGGGGNLYWYMGTQAGSSVSNEGYNLDISGNIQLLAITGNPGVQAQYTHIIPDTIADGQLLVFQVVEDRSGFIRSSTIDGGNVVDPGVTMFVDGNQAGAQIQVRTKWGLPNSPVYIYGSAATPNGSASNSAPDGNWDLNLRNAKPIGSPGDQSDLIGNFTSAPINVPASLSGVTAYFQAYDWDFFESALTPVLVVTFQ
ncbi:MAG: hypothetical protein CMJ93_02175 [Planctomycetes bacterium]|nr:hypothetical protein [Planctomycetota bacterium]